MRRSKLQALADRDWPYAVWALAIALIFCTQRLDDDLWYDELYTLAVFVSRPWSEIVTDYSAPNNHIFYSLLLRGVYLLSDEPFVLRAVSLAFTFGTLLLVFFSGRYVGGKAVAALSTVWLGLTQVFITHTMEVRGYSLSMLLAAGLALLWISERTGPETKGWWRPGLTVVLSACAIYTVPTNALLTFSLGIAAIIKGAVTGKTWRGRLRAVVWYASPWVVGTAIGFLLYLPVMDQLKLAASSTRRLDFYASFSIAYQFFDAVLRDWWPVVPFAIFGLMLPLARGAFSGMPGEWIRRARSDAGSFHLSSSRGPGQGVQPGFSSSSSDDVGTTVEPNPDEGSSNFSVGSAYTWLWIGGGILGPFAVAGVLGIHPFVRNFTIALPFVAIAIGTGFWNSIALLLRLRDQLLRTAWGEGLWGDRDRPADEPAKLSGSKPLPGNNPIPGNNVASKKPRGSGIAGKKLASSKTKTHKTDFGSPVSHESLSHKRPKCFFAILIAEALLCLVAVPRLITYPFRLSAVRQERFTQDGYYNYYAANYRPSAVARYLKLSTTVRAEPYRIVFAKLDYLPLRYYLSREGVPLANPEESRLGIRFPITFWIVTPPKPDFTSLAQETGIPTELLRQAKWYGDFGYYNLYRLELRPNEEGAVGLGEDQHRSSRT